MNSESGRQFPAFEATSLNNKFKQLWLAGIQAKLVFETHAGHAWGSLHVCLGEHPGHQQQPPHPQEEPPCPPRHISPARQRRRERQEAARTVTEAAATEAATAAEKKEDEAENATEPDNLSEVDEETANSNEGQVAAEEAETYQLLKQYPQKMKTACLLQMLMMKFVVMKNTTRKLTQVKLLPVFNAKWNTILTTMWKG